MAKSPTYSDKETEVQIGDHVQVSWLYFIRKTGRVVYVPGQSRRNERFIGQGFEQVGVDVPNGPLVSAIINPDSNSLGKNVRFIKRDSSPVRNLQDIESELEED